MIITPMVAGLDGDCFGDMFGDMFWKFQNGQCWGISILRCPKHITKHGKHINRQHQSMELSWEVEKMLAISMRGFHAEGSSVELTLIETMVISTGFVNGNIFGICRKINH